MGATSGIQWTDATWNPWYGCSKVSPGCAHCYMFREQVQYGRNPEVVTRSKTKFKEPLKWTGPEWVGKRVFTCSWSDFFHPDADGWRPEAWEVIRSTPWLTYQILTKRPERIKACLPEGWWDDFAHVWLGVSAEYQRQLLERLPYLRAAKAWCSFVSCEPLLGPVDLDAVPQSLNVDWWIVGGESGGKEARPFDVRWARQLVGQAREREAAVFVKQLGSAVARANGFADWHGGDWDEWKKAGAADLRVREFPRGL